MTPYNILLGPRSVGVRTSVRDHSSGVYLYLLSRWFNLANTSPPSGVQFGNGCLVFLNQDSRSKVKVIMT